ncbi:MAG: SoxR reducing system RseC family protein [Candidatus Methanoperedens sp.]|nr:SoxR reducing system RseC family protein [Candidatus Methanoperedens sp.]
MTETLFSTFIEIYSWVAASFIMVFVAAIAAFYQKKFEKKTFYYMYIIPIFILFVASVHLFSFNTLVSELIQFTGAVASFAASYYLYRIMFGVKNEY